MDFTAEVEAGIQALDRDFPGWRERINKETLDIWDAKECIVGQLDAPTRDRMDLPPEEREPVYRKYGLSWALGFDHPWYQGPDLQNEWLRRLDEDT